MIRINHIRYHNKKLVPGDVYTFQTDKIKLGGNDLEFTADDLLLADSDSYVKDMDDQSPTPRSDIVASEPVPRPEPSTAIKQNRVSAKLIVMSDDSVMDLKRKIQAEAGIPVYRQHLCYKTDRGQLRQLGYRFVDNPIIDIKEIESATEFIDTIPVSTRDYLRREDTIVESYDEFELIGPIIDSEFSVIDIQDFINRGVIEKVIADSYTRDLVYYSLVIKYWPMLTFSVFGEYIKNESELTSQYPLLAPKTDDIVEMYTKQETVISRLNKAKPVSSEVLIGISTATLYSSDANQVNIRNLFDKLELSESIPYARCRCRINGTMVELQKTFKNTRVNRDYLPSQSILLGIQLKLPNNVYSPSTIVISTTGTYYISTTWRDDYYIDFEKLYQIVEANVNPILTYINLMGRYVTAHDFVLVNSKWTRVTDISMSIYWKQLVSDTDFLKMLKLMTDICEAGIMVPRNSSEQFREYIIRRGMHKFDHTKIEDLVRGLTNYYDRFTDPNTAQKWEDLFFKNRIYRINHRYSDIKFDIINIKEEERQNVINLTNRIIAIMTPEFKTRLPTSDVDRKLKKMKEIDPVLYDFKKAYQSSQILSKKCQKPLQPIIYTPEEFAERRKNMTPEDETHIMEYHNFTTNEPAYYECPNRKFPYARFITGVHPKGYCIPCCKKVQISSESEKSNKKTLIHKECMANHEFTARVQSKKSRYVAAFGKDIDPGRLSTLPETLKTIFVTQNMEDSECVETLGFHVIGIDQSAGSKFNNSGMPRILFSIAFIIDVDPDDILTEIDYYLKNNPDIRRALLTSADLPIRDILATPEDWNAKILAISEIVFGVQLLVINMKNDAPILTVPESARTIKMASRLGLIISKQSDDSEHVINYYPIIYVDHVEFYKTTSITKRIFTSSDKIAGDLVIMMESKLNTPVVITYDQVAEFVDNSRHEMLNIYVYNNKCYAILVQYNKRKVHIAVDDTYIAGFNQFGKSSPIYIYHPYKRSDHEVRIADTLDFLKEYNTQMSDNVTPDFWLRLRRDSGVKSADLAIGFSYKGLHFYGSVTSDDVKRNPAPFKTLYYDPDILNNSLTGNKMGIWPRDRREMDWAMYNKYLYQLILLEFVALFDKQKNLAMRAKLFKILRSRHHRDMFDIPGIDTGDSEILWDLVTEYNTQHHSHDQLVQHINTTIFGFDRTMLRKLRELPIPSLTAELKKLAKTIIVESAVSDMKFDNVFIACSDGFEGSYCDNNKLRIPPGKLDTFLEILASDIKNPLKEKTLFSRAFLTNIIDPYQFERREFETIKITF